MTLWMIGLMLMTMMFVGLVVDFARLVAADRALAAATDAAAAAGANGIDEAHYRATDEVRLDPGRAESFARAAMEAEPEAARLTDFAIAVTPEGITVRSAAHVELSLLGLVISDPLTVRATARAAPLAS